MGWCSGTDIFDPMAAHILKQSHSDDEKVETLAVLIKALGDHDWDCEDDSDYWTNPLVRRAADLAFPDHYEWDDE